MGEMRATMNKLVQTIGFATMLGCTAFTAAAPADLDRYNVVWDSPSKNVSDSMPLGNGDIALNVWVERGDLLFLISKADAWDENSINCKLARIRVKLSPNPFETGRPFRQSLLLRQGEIEIIAGEPGSSVSMRLWVDANQPVVRLESRGEQAFSQQVIMESWRDKERTVTPAVSDLFKNLSGPDPYPTVVFPDVVVTGRSDRLLWCHHNRKPANDPYEINLKLQGMEGYQKVIPHPLLGRTFGAAIKGPGFVPADARTLKSTESAKIHLVSIYPLTTLHPVMPEQWIARLDKETERIDRLPLEKARAGHLAWWSSFWDRSWICSGTEQAFEIVRGYQLCRFMNACAGRGAQPIKHNGSLFSVGDPGNPDARMWGSPGFFYQNQRLIYWPMLAAGDYDLIEPWFKMYREALPFAMARTRVYFKHEGAFFGECITFWGAEVSGHYGWTPFEKRASPLVECPFLTYYWQNNLETIAMMLDCFAHTGDTIFARQTLLPHADEVAKFYDQHYKRDANGKIRFDPAEALETWHTAVNPLPEIVALKTQMPRLLALPSSLTTREQRARWQRLLDDAPPVPIGVKTGPFPRVRTWAMRDDTPPVQLGGTNGVRVLLPAETYSRENNVENPELYGVFPYRLYGLGKPDLQLARDTFAVRKNCQGACWAQNDTQAALLGLSGEASEILSNRASTRYHGRFPAFFRNKIDGYPCIDHGGNLQLALQYMLMQADGQSIRLLPAWPKGWDVSFKLHAPGKTAVECVYRAGRIETLKVTPPSRRKDVILPSADAAVGLRAGPNRGAGEGMRQDGEAHRAQARCSFTPGLGAGVGAGETITEG